MVRYIFVLLSACTLAFCGMAQQETRIQLRKGETFNDVLRNVYAKFDRVNIPYNTLYNRVIGWSNLVDWQQGDTTSPEHIGQAWFDLERAMNKPTDRYELLADRIAMAKSQGILPLVAINFENNTKLNN